MGHLLSFEKAAPGRVLCTKTPAEVHASVIGDLFISHITMSSFFRSEPHACKRPRTTLTHTFTPRCVYLFLWTRRSLPRSPSPTLIAPSLAFILTLILFHECTFGM